MRLSPLRDTTIPKPGESLRSVFFRALSKGGVPRVWEITRHLGISYANQMDLAENDYLDVAELARIIKVPIAELELRRRPMVAAGRRSFGGLVVVNAFETKRRRFAPSSLDLSPHGRELWELKALPFCHETFQLLRDACKCGKVQGWTRPNSFERCDDCGTDLRRLISDDVPIAMRPTIALPSLLASQIETDRVKGAAMLPEEIRTIDRSIVFDIMMRLRAALWNGEGDLHRDLASLHEAALAMTRWPHGLGQTTVLHGTSPEGWSALHRDYHGLAPITDAPGNRGARVASVPAGSGGRMAVRRLPAAAIGGMTRRRESTSTRGSPSAMPTMPMREGNVFKLVGLFEAAKAAKVSAVTLERAAREGLVEGHWRMHGARWTLAFRQEDANAFASLHRARLDLGAVGGRVGLHPAAVAQLVDSNILQARAQSFAGERPHVTSEDLRSFMTDLASAACPAVTEPLTLRRTMLAVNCRVKPWGAFVQAMLEGEVPFQMRNHVPEEGCHRRTRFVGTLFHLIDVPASHLATIAAMPSTPPLRAHRPTVNQLEACEILNISPNTTALDRIASDGGLKRRWPVDSVIGLAGEIIGAGEVAFRMGWMPAEAPARLAAAGARQVEPGLWCRSDVDRMVLKGLLDRAGVGAAWPSSIRRRTRTRSIGGSVRSPMLTGSQSPVQEVVR